MFSARSFHMYQQVRRYAMTDLQKEKITELRKNGESISSIAEKMNLSVNSVKSFCRRKDVSPMKDGCKRCGQPLVNTPGHRQKTFCSASCRQKYWRENSNLIKHISFVSLICPACGKTFSDYKGHHRKYCSHACYIGHRYGGAANGTE
jgi:endogenous inhibitor of DNA gyrase (YacG/DUF329 family)